MYKCDKCDKEYISEKRFLDHRDKCTRSYDKSHTSQRSVALRDTFEKLMQDKEKYKSEAKKYKELSNARFSSARSISNNDSQVVELTSQLLEKERMINELRMKASHAEENFRSSVEADRKSYMLEIESVKGALQAEIFQLTNEKAVLSARLESTVRDFQKKLEMSESANKYQSDQINSKYQQEIDNLNTTVERLKSSHQSAIDQIKEQSDSRIQTEKNKCESMCEQLKQEYLREKSNAERSYNSTIQSLKDDNERKINQLTEEVSSLKTKLSQNQSIYERQMESSAKELSDIMNNMKKNYETQLKNAEEEKIKIRANTMAEYDAIMNDLKNSNSSLTGQLSQYQTSIQNARIEIERYKKDLRELEAKSKVNEEAKENEFNSKLTAIQQERNSVMARNNELVAQMHDLMTENSMKSADAKVATELKEIMSKSLTTLENKYNSMIESYEARIKSLTTDFDKTLQSEHEKTNALQKENLKLASAISQQQSEFMNKISACVMKEKGLVSDYEKKINESESVLLAEKSNFESYRKETVSRINIMQSTISTNNNTIQDLEKKLKTLTNDLDTNSNKILSMRTENENLVSVIRSQTKTISDLQSKLADSNMSITKKMDDAKSMHDEIVSDLSCKLEMSCAEIMTLRSKVDEHDSVVKGKDDEINMLQTKLNSLKEMTETMKKHYSEMIERYKTDKDTITKELNLKREAVEVSNDTAQKLNSRIKELDLELTKIRREHSDKSSRLDKIESENTALKKSVSELTSVVRDKDVEIKILRERPEPRVEEVKIDKPKVEEVKHKMSDTEIKLKKIRDDCLEALRKQKHEVDVLTKQNVSLETEVSLLKKQIEEKNISIEFLKQNKDTLSQSYSDNINLHKQHLESILKDKERLVDDIFRLKEQLNEYARKVADLVKENEEYKKLELEIVDNKTLRNKLATVESEYKELMNEKAGLEIELRKIKNINHSLASKIRN